MLKLKIPYRVQRNFIGFFSNTLCTAREKKSGAGHYLKKKIVFFLSILAEKSKTFITKKKRPTHKVVFIEL